jgi:hypothetical protein
MLFSYMSYDNYSLICSKYYWKIGNFNPVLTFFDHDGNILYETIVDFV